MITGTIQAREGRIRLKVRGSQRREQEIGAVIDTGFTEWLTLPLSLIASLSLRWKNSGRAILADGSECLFDIYSERCCGTAKSAESSFMRQIPTL